MAATATRDAAAAAAVDVAEEEEGAVASAAAVAAAIGASGAAVAAAAVAVTVTVVVVTVIGITCTRVVAGARARGLEAVTGEGVAAAVALDHQLGGDDVSFIPRQAEDTQERSGVVNIETLKTCHRQTLHGKVDISLSVTFHCSAKATQPTHQHNWQTKTRSCAQSHRTNIYVESITK